MHRLWPEDGRNGRLVVGQELGCAVPCVSGGLMLALRDGFGELTRAGAAPRLIAAVERQRPDSRMNVGAG